MATAETNAPASLTPEQSHALFDILTHHETYKEIEDFKYPGAINHYGPPFQDDLSKSDSPILQTLLSKFALKLPGLREVSPEFWKERVADLIEELSKAELSESYDKGILGIRKTLATAISALIEYPARASLEGVEKNLPEKDREYDATNPDDVLRSWNDALQGMVYGSFIDDVFKKAAETDDLSKHSGLVQSMHEFVVVNIASLMHYTLVLSPEGPTLLRMIQSVHNMIPYTAIRQALKIGNVATMLSAVMRVILAKASVGTITNWIGVTSGADEGMNLLQQIIYQVLNWDKRELKNRAAKLEKEKNAPPKEVLSEIRTWLSERSRTEHNECRRQSAEQSMSIVAIIMAMSPHSVEMTEAQHANAMTYLGIQLGIRDRQQIIKALCQRNPDQMTAAVRDAVDAYTPMIRQIHQAVNLSDTMWDFERFLTDMLKMSKPSGAKGQEKPPSVEDYVDLLHRHQASSHKFLHQVAKNGQDVMTWWKEYVHMAAAQFRTDAKPPPTTAVVPEHISAGGAKKAVESAFGSLSADDQKAVKQELTAYQQYLDNLHSASASRIAAVIKRTHTTPYGPGAYLARWQHLMDTTPVTPAKAKGEVRYGGSKSVKEEGRKDVDGNEAGFVTEDQAEKAVDEKTPDAPSVESTIRLLGEDFRAIISGESQ
ncbi:hypothetical protein D0869_11797 [Hortaea werneckii]|uniref:Px domain containing protein n=1 Tax=Hortaea werneckii TaxID=91943 RepID=A0A3M6WAF8_HORWE|nr:hypothetical protein KC355_g934 [Hortaea werneckii]KAI7203299.1 hypothetical protein KC324_g1326 [Hortaea werneckii]KAI7594076.1 hypothetical protein KC316_g1344 [Hortaea werneckii]KAI7651592.1 hypothetical protein KC318_g15592 [Hortaea werneckii]RMX75250.1 hypothetical protein D0869_11797 [Hortaea werneckii]